MIEPYAFVRGVTMVLGITWTVSGILRMVRLATLWERRLAPLGLERRWMRRQVVLACLRATVLDPVNLGLMLFLLFVWSLPGPR